MVSYANELRPTLDPFLHCAQRGLPLLSLQLVLPVAFSEFFHLPTQNL